MIGRRLDEGRHDEALRQAAMLEHFVAEEPFVWASHAIDVARTLVRFHRDGERGDPIRRELEELLATARAIEHGETQGRLARAMAIT